MFALQMSKAQQHWLEFLLAMTEKEIKARYKHAVLGFLWVVLNPLLQMAVIGFVFQFFVPVNVDNYFLFLFAGLLPWNFFTLSISKATPSIIYERSLIQKAKFPREAIVLSIVLSNLFHFLISLILLILLLIGDKIFFDHYSFTQLFWYINKMLLVVPAILWLTVLTSCLSLFFSALNVRFRDVNFMVQALLPLWFYATPIIYSLNLLPSIFQFLVYLNPVTAIIELFQFAFINQTPVAVEKWGLSLIITLIISIVGVLVFKKEAPYFDDWV